MNAPVTQFASISPQAKMRGAAAAAWLCICSAIAAALLLAALNALSAEFDPSWRVVSEYANGQYAWVLSLMFACLAVSSWALAFALRSRVRGIAGRLGLWLLVSAGVGQATAVAFDINQPLHGLADTSVLAVYPSRL